MKFEVRKLERFGAEVVGFDASGPVSDGDIESLKRAVAEHQFVVLRDQQLTPAQLSGFGRRWGELDTEGEVVHPSLKEHPEITALSNDPEKGHSYVGRYWHSDGTFQERAVRYTLLYAHRVPQRGGETLIADAYVAHQGLPEEVRGKIDGARAVHLNRREVPMSLIHPETRRRALYVNLGNTLAIKGRNILETAWLIEWLDRYLDDGPHTYAHPYRQGDLMVQDALSVLHKASGGPTEGLRVMYRVTVLLPRDFVPEACPL